MKKLITILSLSCVSTFANASIVCEGNTDSKASVKLTIQENSSGISAALEVEGSDEVRYQEDFPKVEEVWEGRFAGLKSSRGLSVKYENLYGCIRNASITATISGHVETISVPVCRGGTIPDDLCFPKRD